MTTAVLSQTSQTSAPGTLAAILAQLDQDRRLPEPRRKQFRGAIQTVCKILNRPPDAVPSSLPEIARLLDEVPALAIKQSRKTLANIRSTLRAALLHCAGDTGVPPSGTPLQPEWAALKGRLSDLRLRNGLSQLIRFASYRGIAPEAMSDDVFQSIAQVVGSINWGRNVGAFERNAPRCWNEAVAAVPRWPQVRLRETAREPRPVHLPLSAYPVTFQNEVAAFLERSAEPNRFVENAPAKPLKTSTLHLRQMQLRAAASTLAQALGGPEAITSLAVLVQPDHVRKILSTLYKPEKGFDAYTSGICMTLKLVAKSWVNAAEDDLRQLAVLQRRLGGAPAGLTDKNRHLLRQFDDPARVRQLLLLPETLRQGIRTRRLSPGRRLQQLQVALAIDILLVAPLRVSNLASLQVDRQLQWPSGRGGPLFIVLNDNETKNEQALEYPLPVRVRDSLHEYLDRYRSSVSDPRGPWLFVNLAGAPVAATTLGDGIKKAIKRHLGIDFTPHQFRHLAAKIALDADPGALGLVKDLLGHKNYKTTVNAYAGLRTRQAGHRYDLLLDKHRDAATGTR